MIFRKAWRGAGGRGIALALVLTAACGCNRKTPVPFKRDTPDAGPAVVDAGAPIQASAEAQSYADGLQQVRVADTTISRPNGVIHASLARDFDGDQQPDVVIVASDERAQAQLEVIAHGSARAGATLTLSTEPVASNCRAISAQLAELTGKLVLASVVSLCEPPPDPLAAAVSGEAAKAQPAAASPANANEAPPPAPPPEPGTSVAITQHYAVRIDGTTTAPQLVLRVAATWSDSEEPLSPELKVTADDVDGDQQNDVSVTLQLTAAGASMPTTKPNAKNKAPELPAQITLTWLNRPTGLAREQAEPEATLTALANDALQVAPKRPEGGRVLATRALRLHHLLCKESGVAQLWVGGARGVACGVSAAAGKAAAAKAISLALTQQILPALEARAELDDPALSIDKKTRQQVSTAIGSMQGDTTYQWHAHAGPNLRAGGAPLLRLPLLGFIDENTLLLRGPTAQSYDLTTHTATPTGIPGSVLATDAKHRFALVDIVRSCGGFHVRSVPAAQVIGGIVTGTPTAEPLLSPAPSSAEANGCSMRPHSDRGGFVLLGMTPSSALFARGRQLVALPFDALGQVTEPARDIPGSEVLPPLSTPGPLDASGRYLALATSEGVALIDRAQVSARLVRTPASCAGSTVSDAALSPSGRKLAMLCGGRVYVAEPAAVSGPGDRPTLEHP